MIKLLHLMAPETAHSFTVAMLKRGINPCYKPVRDARLNVTLWEGTDKQITYQNPIGLAAGFDKNAETMKAMFQMGFGSVEVGSITPKPQYGNPKPRIFRLSEDLGVINRLGFNNKGADVAYQNIEKFLKHKKETQVLGINIGKNKDTKKAADDYVKGIEMFGGQADYMTVNISSPNTKGLRDLQQKSDLKDLLNAVRKALKKHERSIPLLVKVAPDLNETEIADIVEVVQDQNIDGLIVSNTTISRPETLQSEYAGETGGLSGAPVFELSTKILNRFYVLTQGKLPLIGVGGVSTPEHAIAKIHAGASLVQLYSGMVYEGPSIAKKINQGLVQYMDREGVKSIKEMIGENK